MARRAFVQESLKCVTSPTSDRKYLQIGPNSRLPQDVHFLAHFYFHRNQITLSICGDTSFLPSFLRSIVIFKAISHISGSKKWSKRRGTHARTDEQTHIKILRPPAQKPFGQLCGQGRLTMRPREAHVPVLNNT